MNSNVNESKHFIKGGLKLRSGYTTGSCATAAASMAVRLLLTSQEQEFAHISLPNGEKVIFFPSRCELSEGVAICSVIKDAGDDPDVTDGCEIVATCKLVEQPIINITGGQGVGFVTSEGLRCRKGDYAINPVPRSMIEKNVKNIFNDFNYSNGVDIVISVPKGEEIARKTFNPRLGIIGGISILGTTGIVEPMSDKAIVDTIKIMVDRQYIVDEHNILISPGNYGRAYCLEHLFIDIDKSIKYSNYLGETLDYIYYKKFKRVLIVGHVGKLVKVAGSIMNTHSNIADCRMEIIAAHAAMVGGSYQLINNIMSAKTTYEALNFLHNEGLFEKVSNTLIHKIEEHVGYRLKHSVDVGIIMFFDENSILGQSSNATDLLPYFL